MPGSLTEPEVLKRQWRARSNAVRLYMDQDSLDFDVISGLRMAGIDVLSSEEAGMKRATDEEQLNFATSGGRVIYTANQRDTHGSTTTG